MAELPEVTALRDIVARVEQMLDVQRRVLRSWPGLYKGTEPEFMVDPNGRPLMLDAMLRLLEARTVLARVVTDGA